MSSLHDAVSGRRRDYDGIIARIAGEQHGVVSRRQLVGAGVPPDVVDRRLKASRLKRVHRGVFEVGPLQAPYRLEMASALACGESAVVSHRSAAWPWQMISRRPDGPVDVGGRCGDCGGRKGIRFHRLRTLRTGEVTRLDGIPITTPARTLLDLSTVAESHELERAFCQALARELTDRSAILSVLEGRGRQPGTRRLRALLGGQVEAALTRSEAEERLLALIHRVGLPSPAVNARICGYEVDFLWRPQRFVVEVDGYAYHSSSSMFESDRRRDATLAAAGVRVTRVTWRQLVAEPEALLVRLALALAR